MTSKITPYIEKNIMFWLFFSSIFLDYVLINKVYYIFYFLALLILFYDIWKLDGTKHHKIIYDKKLLILSIYFFTYIVIITILNFKLIGYTPAIRLFTRSFIAVYIFLKLNTYGEKYIINFYKYFIIIVNAFALLNIIEILSKKSLFYNFLMSNAKNWQISVFYTENFRTFSIFAHPIVYALFLLILFWCNKFLIKNNFIRYLLQLNIILNIFFTKSRSTWIAFLITLILYYSKNIIINIKNNNFKFTYKKICIMLGILIIIILCIIIFQNNIVYILNEVFQRFVTVTDDSYGDVSRLQRTGTIELINNYMTSNGIINFLFGNGYSSVNKFMIDHTIVISGFSTTDNQYLSFFYDFGIIGLLLYIFIIILAVISFFKNSKMDINNLSILCFLSISICMFFFENFGWTNVFIFLVISIFFMSVKNNKFDYKEKI